MTLSSRVFTCAQWTSPSTTTVSMVTWMKPSLSVRWTKKRRSWSRPRTNVLCKLSTLVRLKLRLLFIVLVNGVLLPDCTAPVQYCVLCVPCTCVCSGVLQSWSCGLSSPPVKPGVRYRELGNIIQKHAQANGFSVVRSYCGHGIHRLFHTAPNVPHYASGCRSRNVNVTLTLTLTVTCFNTAAVCCWLPRKQSSRCDEAWSRVHHRAHDLWRSVCYIYVCVCICVYEYMFILCMHI